MKPEIKIHEIQHAYFKRDLTKLIFLMLGILLVAAVFIFTPALFGPTLLSFVIALLVSPAVKILDRLGLPRWKALAIVFSGLSIVAVVSGVFGSKLLFRQMTSFKESAPEYFSKSVLRMREMEFNLKAQFPVLEAFHPTDKIMDYVETSGHWLMKNGPALFGDFITWLFLVPLITFLILKDGANIRRKFFTLVPNRFFEPVFMISSRIHHGISDYVRAKTLEAFLVFLMVSIGLVCIDMRYALLFGLIAGITNILPYIGPIIGAVPGILVVMFDPSLSHLFWPVIVVYLIANVIDTVVIFPVVVAKIVDLHPMILLSVVFVGGHFYGFLGMLFSIPIATSIKVVLQEVHAVVYQPIRYRSADSQKARVIAFERPQP